LSKISRLIRKVYTINQINPIPLGPVTAIVNGKVTLVGVVSFGGQNCPNNLPVGFARVSFQKDWILSNTDAGDWQCNGTTSGNQINGKPLKTVSFERK
jgi:hypothetical protein